MQRWCIHVEKHLKPNQASFMFLNIALAHEGKATGLQPYYYYLISIFRATIDPRSGDDIYLHVWDVNLLNHIADGGMTFSIFGFIWNELRRAMYDPWKGLPYAPYIMFMIQKVSKTTLSQGCDS